MFKRLSPIVAVGLLSGCTLTNGAAYHQETLDAIARSETNIANKVQNLELQLSNQSDYIESLEDEITTLSQQLDVHLTSMEHKVIEELEEEASRSCSGSCCSNFTAYDPWRHRKSLNRLYQTKLRCSC